MSAARDGRATLAASGVAALLASVCCLGPLALVLLGVSGAWIGNLTALQPYSPYFASAALVALAFAGRQMFRPAAACKPCEVCAVPAGRRAYGVLFWIVAALIALALTFPYYAPLFY
ncbi:MAG: hypothetical protein AMXMBFR72_36120 [Betaproteobacteria bacterium]